MAKCYPVVTAAAVRELILFAENHYPWYEKTYLPTKANLARKMRRGVYDPEKGAVLWGYALTVAAKQYEAEYGSFVPRGSLAPTVREAARQFEEQERAHLLEEG